MWGILVSVSSVLAERNPKLLSKTDGERICMSEWVRRLDGEGRCETRRDELFLKQRSSALLEGANTTEVLVSPRNKARCRERYESL